MYSIISVSSHWAGHGRQSYLLNSNVIFLMLCILLARPNRDHAIRETLTIYTGLGGTVGFSYTEMLAF